MPDTDREKIAHAGVRLMVKNPQFKVDIDLPSSKSESNRALIVQALSKGEVQVNNLSSAADTQTMIALLDKISSNENHGDPSVPCLLDVGPAGTVMRFLTAFLCIQSGKYILTGSARMQQRPVRILVEALQHLGADIQYKAIDGYPPLLIKGQSLKEQQVSIPGNISSQYISALLMLAPLMANGLQLDIEGGLTSSPYVQMTLNMLDEAGIKSSWTNNCIHINRQHFIQTTLEVESDWSGASYWFSVAALSEEANIFLKGLKVKSLQGDSAICSIMEYFGVMHAFEPGGLRITKAKASIKSDQEPTSVRLLNFKECPDLAQTVIVCAAGLGIEASFTGLETLRIKETDRIAALHNELGHIGVSIVQEDDVYHLDVSKLKIPEQAFFKTYEDHRMAMALAPLALIIGTISFDEPNVVNKSYPSFWKDLEKAGFSVNLE